MKSNANKDSFHNGLCICESMGGRFGSHRHDCPTMTARANEVVDRIFPPEPGRCGCWKSTCPECGPRRRGDCTFPPTQRGDA